MIEDLDTSVTPYRRASSSYTFPSQKHLDHLRHAFRPNGSESSGSLKNLSEDEKWHWHAYTYGFRKVLMSSLEKRSPIDPDGKWYDEHLAWSAEQFYRVVLGKGGECAAIAERNRVFAEASEWRQNFAEEHGFRDFGEVMAYGIARSWSRRASEE